MTNTHKGTCIRIASYNIRKAKGLDQRRDPQRILTVLNGLGADVVALQEVDHRLGDRPTALPRDMITAESDFEVVEIAANDVSLGWHGNAILVRKGLVTGDVQRIALPGLEPRGAVSVTVLGVTVIGVHLGLLRKSRKRQLDRLASIARDGGNTVIAGDFNEWSASRGLEPLADQFAVHQPGATFHAGRPIAALDRFALTQRLALTDAGVDQSPLARRASDHLPIWADIATTSASV